MTLVCKRPDETRDEFIARVADLCPPLTHELVTRLAALLPLPQDSEAGARDAS